jgi:hypothetical protein
MNKPDERRHPRTSCWPGILMLVAVGITIFVVFKLVAFADRGLGGDGSCGLS